MIDVEKLSEYVEAGDRIGYWTVLNEMGDPYGKLALGVALNDTVAGATANGFFLRGALDQRDKGITSEELADISHKLMIEDFRLRENDADGILDSRQIENYHEKVFEEKGVTIEAWTAHAPLAILGSPGEEVREQVWNAMLAEWGITGGIVPQTGIYFMMNALSFPATAETLALNEAEFRGAVNVTNLALPDGMELDVSYFNYSDNVRSPAREWAGEITAMTFNPFSSVLFSASGDYGSYTYEYTDPISGEQTTIVVGGTSNSDVIEGYDAPDPDAVVDPLDPIPPSGNDILIGFAGDDVLIATSGTDRLYGGDGADTFVVTSGVGITFISDAEGADELLLRFDPNDMQNAIDYANTVANEQELRGVSFGEGVGENEAITIAGGVRTWPAGLEEIDYFSIITYSVGWTETFNDSSVISWDNEFENSYLFLDKLGYSFSDTVVGISEEDPEQVVDVEIDTYGTYFNVDFTLLSEVESSRWMEMFPELDEFVLDGDEMIITTYLYDEEFFEGASTSNPFGTPPEEAEQRGRGLVIVDDWQQGDLGIAIGDLPVPMAELDALTANLNTDFGRTSEILPPDDFSADNEPIDIALNNVPLVVVREDTNNLRDWDVKTVTFNRSGERVKVETLFDNSDVRVDTYADGNRATSIFTDTSETRAWSTLSTTYDPDGDKTSTTLVYDDGNVRRTQFENGERSSDAIEDTAETELWVSVETQFDSEGDPATKSFVYDDGTTRTTEFVDGVRSFSTIVDTDDAKSWAYRTTQFDSAGGRTTQTTAFDNEDVRTDLFAGNAKVESVFEDVSDTRNWTSRTQTFDVNGNVSGTEYVWDDPLIS